MESDSVCNQKGWLRNRMTGKRESDLFTNMNTHRHQTIRSPLPINHEYYNFQELLSRIWFGDLNSAQIFDLLSQRSNYNCPITCKCPIDDFFIFFFVEWGGGVMDRNCNIYTTAVVWTHRLTRSYRNFSQSNCDVESGSTVSLISLPPL